MAKREQGKESVLGRVHRRTDVPLEHRPLLVIGRAFLELVLFTVSLWLTEKIGLVDLRVEDQHDDMPLNHAAVWFGIAIFTVVIAWEVADSFLPQPILEIVVLRIITESATFFVVLVLLFSSNLLELAVVADDMGTASTADDDLLSGAETAGILALIFTAASAPLEVADAYRRKRLKKRTF